MGILETLFGRAAAKKAAAAEAAKSAAQRYADLVGRLAIDAPAKADTAEAVERLLADAGQTPETLAAAVTVRRKVNALRAELAKVADLDAESAEVERQRGVMLAELAADAADLAERWGAVAAAGRRAEEGFAAADAAAEELAGIDGSFDLAAFRTARLPAATWRRELAEATAARIGGLAGAFRAVAADPLMPLDQHRAGQFAQWLADFQKVTAENAAAWANFAGGREAFIKRTAAAALADGIAAVRSTIEGALDRARQLHTAARKSQKDGSPESIFRAAVTAAAWERLEQERSAKAPKNAEQLDAFRARLAAFPTRDELVAAAESVARPVQLAETPITELLFPEPDNRGRRVSREEWAKS